MEIKNQQNYSLSLKTLKKLITQNIVYYLARVEAFFVDALIIGVLKSI